MKKFLLLCNLVLMTFFANAQNIINARNFPAAHRISTTLTNARNRTIANDNVFPEHSQATRTNKNHEAF